MTAPGGPHSPSHVRKPHGAGKPSPDPIGMAAAGGGRAPVYSAAVARYARRLSHALSEATSTLIAVLRGGPGALILRLLVALDVALISLHIVKWAGGARGTNYFLITADRSYGEFAQYGKMLWVALLLMALWRVWRTPFFLASAAVACYALADDALTLHERVRDYVPVTLPPEYAPLQMHVQEALFLLATGTVLLVPFAVTYFRTPAAARTTARPVALLFFVIAFFAVVVDLVHMLGDAAWYLDTMAVVEDGGEMLAASVLTAFLFSTVAKTMTVSPAPSLVDRVQTSPTLAGGDVEQKAPVGALARN
jgi:hypothetical protein